MFNDGMRWFRVPTRVRCGAVGLLCLVSKAPLLTLLALSRCMPWDCPHDTAVARGDVEERLAKCKYACGVVLGGWYVYLAPNLTSPDKGSCEVWVGG